MNRLDHDQPSIFPRPDPEAGGHAPTSFDDAPTGRVRPLAARAGAAGGPVRGRGTSRQLIALGGTGLGVIALAGFIAASVLRAPAEDPALAGTSATAPTAHAPVAVSGTPSLQASPSTSVMTSTAATPPLPTPIPTPAGPPRELATGGWATVTVEELNVREGPGLDKPRAHTLVRGAVVHVAEGPIGVEGRNWYRVASLGGARGWATSGEEGAPFLKTLVEDSYLLHCDTVESAVWTPTSGGAQANDPIRIGELALPAGAFDSFELGVLNLLYGTGGDACFGATIDPSGEPVVYGDVFAIACGRVERMSGDALALQPAAGQDVIAEYQVKRLTLVEGVLDSQVDGSPTATNLRAVLAVAALDDSARRCVHARSTEGPDGVERFQQVDGHQCLIVVEWTATALQVGTPASHLQRVTLVPIGDVNRTVPIGTPVRLMLFAYDFYPATESSLSLDPLGGC